MTNNEYTAAVLSLVNEGLAREIPGTITLAPVTDEKGTWNAANLGDGTVLVASTRDHAATWTTDVEPALRLDRFTEEAWAAFNPPYISAVTSGVTSAQAVNQALTDVGITHVNWLNGWHRRNDRIMAIAYTAELDALARLGLTARVEDSSRGCYVIVVELPDGHTLYIGTENVDDPFLPTDRSALTGWSVDRVDTNHEVVGRPFGEPLEVPHDTTNITTEALAALVIKRGHAPLIDSDGRGLHGGDTDELTIADVAASVIADLAPLMAQDSRLATATSFDELQDHIDANVLADDTIRAFERQGHEWADFAPDMQDIVTCWLKTRPRA